MGDESEGCACSAGLLPRPDLRAEEQTLRDILSSAAPAFDKRTEDGTQFLIYKLGSLEVRATRDLSGELSVGTVYDISGIMQAKAAAGRPVAKDSGKIVKATEFVERAPSGDCHYYLTLDTEDNHSILMEKLPDGTVVWMESPVDLKMRNAVAKVTRSADCSVSAVTIGMMRSIHRQELSQAAPIASVSQCKHYVRAAYRAASGQI